MTRLETYIQGSLGVAEKDLAAIASSFTPLHVPKGTHVVRSGHVCGRLAFVESGVLREYVEAGGKEVTKWICTEGYFVVDLASFLFRQPGRWSIEALADTELHVIEHGRYLRLGQVVPDWAELEKRFIARCFTSLEDRVVMHLAMSAAERYDLFFAQHRDLINRVPLHYLASLLGMTPETFSRLRARR
jgi:CRP-like cAMP-binding protein